MRRTMMRIMDEVSTFAVHRTIHVQHKMLSAIACEVLARKIVHVTPPHRLASVMSTRYRHRQRDGDISSLGSALELAIDQHWYIFCNHSGICSCIGSTIFLSSTEAQQGISLPSWPFFRDRLNQSKSWNFFGKEH